jgi:signal transduction histidine kinase
MVSLGVLGSALYLIAYMTSDIAAQLYRQQEAYRQANLQLERKDRIKDEYVARVTHHIKGHLAAIKSCNDVVVLGMAGPLSDKQKGFVETSANRTRNLVTFVKKLLRLTQMRLSDDQESSEFSLTDTLSAAVAGAMSGAEEKAITLTSDVHLTRDIVYGEPFSIDEIVTTMLFNAIKFTPTGGKVSVHAELEDGHIRVDITDTGIGIPEEEIPRVFDEFYRASNAISVEKEGTGLGLAIAKQVVERHGGRIWVSSEEGKGSVFSFAFPLAKSG